MKAMAALAEQPPTGPKEGDHVAAGSSSSSSSGGSGGVVQATAGQATAENGEGEVVYTCRMCRRVVFAERDIEDHETAKHSFHRRKSKGVTSKGICSSIFLAEPSRWMKRQAREADGKLTCPNKTCGARLGSFKWTGAQCSCGSWVTPAIQFPRKNLDPRSTAPARPAPGTVVHPSLLLGLRPGQESDGGDAAAAAAAASGGGDAGGGGSGDVVAASASRPAREDCREDEKKTPEEDVPI